MNESDTKPDAAPAAGQPDAAQSTAAQPDAATQTEPKGREWVREEVETATSTTGAGQPQPQPSTTGTQPVVVKRKPGRPKGSKTKKAVVPQSGKLGVQGPTPGEQAVEEYGHKVEIPDDRLAKVGASCGLTINLGDYQSARIGVWAEMPCDKDATKETYDRVLASITDRLTAEVEKIKQYRNGKVTIDSPKSNGAAKAAVGDAKPSATETERTGL